MCKRLGTCPNFNGAPIKPTRSLPSPRDTLPKFLAKKIKGSQTKKLPGYYVWRGEVKKMFS